MVQCSINISTRVDKAENTVMTDADIEAIERATVNAVSPTQVQQIDGWLLPMDLGTVGRAKSAVPLTHRAADQAVVQQVIARVEAAYRAQGFVPVFRLADEPCFDAFRLALSGRGYRAGAPVLVQWAPVEAVRAVSTANPAEVASAPDADWASVFLSEGFDPVDGAHRVRALSRTPGSVFASVREAGQTVAAGAGAFSHGWGSVHGMRTHQAFRGQGLAGRVLAGLAQAAAERNVQRLFLQVDEANAPALALYRRAGFVTAWRYAYWSPA